MKIKSYASGGVVQGPPHEQGGVPAIDQSGQQIAEVEGNERIFSVEDTQELEQMATSISQLPAQDADVAARELGYRVVDMIVGQDAAQAQQDAALAPASAQQQQPPPPAQGQPVPEGAPSQENFEQVDPALAGLV